MKKTGSLNHMRSYNREIRSWLQAVARFTARIEKSSLRRRACPACGAAASTLFANNGALAYERCARCALVFMNPTFPLGAVERGFRGEDRLLRRYFEIMKRFKGAPAPGKPDPRSDAKLKDIYSHKKAGRLLDVGCSVGDFLHKAKHFYSAEGLEVNPRTAAIAAKSFTVHRGTLDELKLPPVYDVVTLHQILYGVRDPLAVLRGCRDILAKNGILYVNTPNADSLALKLYGGQANHLYGYTTQQVFGRRSLEAAARRAGLRLVSFRTEWLDVYIPDIVEFLSHPDRFIHKRNTHLAGYEDAVREEDELHARRGLALGDGGNYLVAILRRE